MIFGVKNAVPVLFFGDIAVFSFSLWLTLVVRYWGIPSAEILQLHAWPFSFLFAFWILVFYITGLYGKGVILFKNEFPRAMLRAQIFNVVAAALFFFFIPQIGIAPKTNLAIYLVISLALIFVWRLAVFPRITRPSSRERAAIIGSGPEVDELVREVNNNRRYYLEFYVVADPLVLKGSAFDAFARDLSEANVSIIVIDTEHDAVRAILPRVYELAFVSKRYQFINFYRVYEDVFDRVPLSLLQYGWFLKNVSLTETTVYALMKRLIDIIGGLAMGLVTLVAIPFVFIAMRLEGPGPLFITQTRFGQGGSRTQVYKFRSMRFSDQGAWKGEGANRITRVGSILRKTSLDEFPQFLNVLRGDLSLIGPRNDIESLGLRLAEAIPYYNVRYVVKPGITGWAQINQRYEPGNISPQSIEETKVRLAYDFYYIKNRSLALDIVIALKTLKRLFFRVSSW